MKIICAWCKKIMGEKEPFEDKRITHGICPECIPVMKGEPKTVKKNIPKYCPERVTSPKKYDPRSFRMKKAKKHRLVFGCPKGKYSTSTGKCKVPVELQSIRHPVGEKICPVGGREIGKNPRRGKERMYELESIAVKMYMKGHGRGYVHKTLVDSYGMSGPLAEHLAKRAASIIAGKAKKVTPATHKLLISKIDKNPKGRSCSVFNAPKGAVKIYDKILKIEAVKGGKGESLFPKQKFYHPFKNKTKAAIYGLSDGSILVKSQKGKRLWQNVSGYKKGRDYK